MVELKFITVVNGAQCAMITGVSMMRTWCVVSLVFPVLPLLPKAQHMVRDLVLSEWTTFAAKEERLPCLIVLTMAGETKTVVITKMQA